jgi:phosphoglycerate transport regulatory protein PgtC
MSSPSRSGTTHLTVETMLQGEGWDKGWSQLLQIAGNCAAITERSFGVPDGVNNGQFGIGLVIDFFGLAGKYSGFPVEFVYPDVTAVVPANIALVAGGKNPPKPGSSSPTPCPPKASSCCSTRRSRACPSCRPTPAEGAGGLPEPFEIAKRAKVQFNSDLSESRYNVVSAMFDQTITFRLKELQAATKAIHAAEAALAEEAQCRAAGAGQAGARSGLLARGWAVDGRQQGLPGRCSRRTRRTLRSTSRSQAWKTAGTAMRATTTRAPGRWPNRP